MLVTVFHVGQRHVVKKVIMVKMCLLNVDLRNASQHDSLSGPLCNLQ